MNQVKWILRRVGRRIRQLREDKGFTQEGFAAEVNFDRSYYGCVERGEKNISLKKLAKIADTLNMPIETLFEKTSK
jgi:transcriptional regulator with XRE-family HTH domain